MFFNVHWGYALGFDPWPNEAQRGLPVRCASEAGASRIAAAERELKVQEHEITAPGPGPLERMGLAIEIGCGSTNLGTLPPIHVATDRGSLQFPFESFRYFPTGAMLVGGRGTPQMAW